MYEFSPVCALPAPLAAAMREETELLSKGGRVLSDPTLTAKDREALEAKYHPPVATDADFTF